MKYLSVTTYAKQVARDPSRIRRLCSQGRIAGAFKPEGGQWVIPAGAAIKPPWEWRDELLRLNKKAAIKRLGE